jgi:hypothetical protein
MTVDDTTSPDRRTATAIPGPRTTEPTSPGRDALSLESRTGRRVRPPSEYWDVETAHWTTRSPIPGPRRG